MSDAATSNPSPAGELVLRLERIAKKNDDAFRYTIVIEPSRKGIAYFFHCDETADGHTFVSGRGATIEEAVQKATADLESACTEWGYDLVD